MSRGFWAVASSIALTALVTSAIWTSRPIVNENPQLGTIRYGRLLGRIVEITVDEDGDGRPESLSRYRWQVPYDPYLNNYSGQFCDDTGHHLEDRNRDGRWDTWYHSISEVGEGRCVYAFEADTNDDGRPDWFRESSDTISVYAQLSEVRGF